MTAPQLPATTATAGFAADPYAASQGQFVAVGTDKATGRVIIALDDAAAHALAGLFDRFLCSDDGMYPQDDTDKAAAVVASAINQPLLKLHGYR